MSGPTLHALKVLHFDPERFRVSRFDPQTDVTQISRACLKLGLTITLVLQSGFSLNLYSNLVPQDIFVPLLTLF
jgi:hypothetical protein